MQVVATKINIDQLPSSWGEFSRARAQSWYRNKFSKPQKQFLSTRLEVTRAQTRARAERAFRAKIFRSEASSNFCLKIANYYFFHDRSKAHCFLLFDGIRTLDKLSSLPKFAFRAKTKKSFLLTSTFFVEKFKNNFSDIFPPKVEQTFFAKSHFRSEKNRKERH